MTANLNRTAAEQRLRPGNGSLRSTQGPQGEILITGGAGFIGSNLADRLLRDGHHVLVFDNLSRAGVRKNLEWLLHNHPRRLQVIVADVRDADAIQRAVRRSSAVFHFAAQVAVTTSLSEPRDDFEVNAGGTLNVLEALRSLDRPPPLLFTSTNKVYGALDDLALVECESRYSPAAGTPAAGGINELQRLDFHSAYGCSKGCADQYVIDYSRTFGLRTVVLRMSCIYGPHQCGTEDQGWVSHVIASIVGRRPFTIYGDGKQVRDLLFIDDLIEGFLLSMANADRLAGQAFNVGGGPANTVSLIELLNLVTSLSGRSPELRFAGWRPGDQKYYVSNTAKFSAATGWRPRIDVREGVERVYRWLKQAPHFGVERPDVLPSSN
jgi:CDP-paratose 2-epimerase